MEAIDAINRKNGYGTIRQAIQGTDVPIRPETRVHVEAVYHEHP